MVKQEFIIISEMSLSIQWLKVKQFFFSKEIEIFEILAKSYLYYFSIYFFKKIIIDFANKIGKN